MDTSLIITLIVAILTVAAGVVGAAITNIHKGYKERLSKHVQPIVSICDDRVDNIDKKCLDLNNKTNQCSYWFTSLNKVEDMVKYNYYYIIIKNNDKYKMKECHISIITATADNSKDTKEYDVGDLSINRNSIVPLKNENDINEIKCLIEYKTESGELLLFIMEMNCDNNGTFIPSVGKQKLKNRHYQRQEIRKYKKEEKDNKLRKNKNEKEIVIEKEKIKGKIIDVIKYKTSLSYSSQEILNALKGKKLYKGDTE